ncbi:MAG TPA: hypothetical protein VMD25_06500 [Acidobacteriaceae bacterium]|nr:hypothetical protein [Acidobacteriaceae bacterium]
MLSRFGSTLLLLAAVAAPAAASAQSAAPSPLGPLRAALAQVSQSVNAVQTRRWKAPASVRSAVDGDVEAIQRDLNGTLAGLLQQADAAPGSVPAQFAVYRNVDALYDTLLRVVETAELAAPEDEISALESALQGLETARSSLGDTILSGAQSEQTQLVRLRSAINAAAAAQRTPIKTTVIDDYSAHEAPAHHRPAAKKPTAATRKPSSSSSSSTQPGSNPH